VEAGGKAILARRLDATCHIAAVKTLLAGGPIACLLALQALQRLPALIALLPAQIAQFLPLPRQKLTPFSLAQVACAQLLTLPRLQLADLPAFLRLQLPDLLALLEPHLPLILCGADLWRPDRRPMRVASLRALLPPQCALFHALLTPLGGTRLRRRRGTSDRARRSGYARRRRLARR
jgi:hypothetical protein